MESLTVPLSGRNGRFFLAEFSVSLTLAQRHFTETERWFDTNDSLGSRKPFGTKEEKDGEARSGNEIG